MPTNDETEQERLLRYLKRKPFSDVHSAAQSMANAGITYKSGKYEEMLAEFGWTYLEILDQMYLMGKINKELLEIAKNQARSKDLQKWI